MSNELLIRLLIGITAFIIGTGFGYVSRRYEEKKHSQKNAHKKHKTPFNPRNFIVVTLVVGMLVSILAEIAVPAYKTNPAFYGVIGIAIGFYFKDKE